MKLVKHKEREFNLDASIYQKIFDNSHDSLLVINSDDQIISANSAACSLFGIAIDDFECKSLYNVVDGADYRLIHLLKRRDQAGKAEGEINFIKKDGSKFLCKVTSYLIENADELPVVIMEISEIHEHKNAEEKLREDLLCFQSAFDATYDGMWDLDMRTNRLYLSPNALKIFDYKQPAILNRDKIWNNLIHEKDKSRLEKEIRPIINGETDLMDVESRVKTDPGVLKWVRIRGKTIFSEKDGKIIRIVGTLADITSYKLSDEELKRKQNQFKHYFEDSPIGLAINTFNDSWVELNQELCDMLGFKKEELREKSWTEVIHSDDIQPTLKLIEDATDGKIDSFKIDNRFVRKNGEILYVTLSCVCIRNDDGSIHHFLTSLIDISERVKTEEKLKNERIILSTLINSLPISIYIIDKEGRKVISNKYDLEIIGFNSVAEVLGKTDRELFPGEVGERGHLDNMFVINKKAAIRNRLENFYDKNGNQRWFLTNKVPLLDQNNQAYGLIGFGIDITDLRNLQQKVKDSEAYYRTLVNISPDGVMVADAEGRITFSSKRILSILGIPDRENLIGESIFNWVAPEYLDSAIKNFREVFNGERTPQTSEYICFRFDKSKFWIELSGAVLYDASGVSIGLMMLCRDITARKKAEEDLISAKIQAEESDILKTALLRNISHEIRTPLNAVLGFSELLREAFNNKEEFLSYVKIIQQSSYQLLSIINTLIDISSIEASIIKKQKSIINLNGLLRDIQNQFRFEASSKNLTLKLTEGVSNDMANIHTDKTKLEQIICSLLSNALKFTKTGQISFGYSHNDSFLEFYVSDTGIGIELKYHSKIFETFFQIENELSKRYEGIGMGLSICKAYVRLLGGEIWLTSKFGEGSTFFFTIPYEHGEKLLNEESNLSNQVSSC